MRRPRGGAAGLATTDKTDVTRLLAPVFHDGADGGIAA